MAKAISEEEAIALCDTGEWVTDLEARDEISSYASPIFNSLVARSNIEAYDLEKLERVWNSLPPVLERAFEHRYIIRGSSSYFLMFFCCDFASSVC
jgi:hypothetical protein